MLCLSVPNILSRVKLPVYAKITTHEIIKFKIKKIFIIPETHTSPVHMIKHKTKNFWRLYMSDLTATGCGCNTSANNNSGFGCSSLIWIILLLCCCGGCGGNGSFFGGNSDNGCGCDFIWIILLLFCCGNNGNGNSCGCGC